MSQESPRAATVTTVATRRGVAAVRHLRCTSAWLPALATYALAHRPLLDTAGVSRNLLTERTHR